MDEKGKENKNRRGKKKVPHTLYTRTRQLHQHDPKLHLPSSATWSRAPSTGVPLLDLDLERVRLRDLDRDLLLDLERDLLRDLGVGKNGGKEC